MNNIDTFQKCVGCKSLVDTESDSAVSVNSKLDDTHYYLCFECASTCFDCGQQYKTSILNADNEPWCDACVALFREDRKAWAQRWNDKVV